MKISPIASVCLLLSFSAAFGQSGSDVAQNRRDRVAKALASIVQIDMPNQSRGSGFWISRRRVITCLHVIQGNDGSQVKVKSAVDGSYEVGPNALQIKSDWIVFSGKVIGIDKDNDLALIEISRPAVEKEFVNLRSHSFRNHVRSAVTQPIPPETLSAVYLAGFPLGKPYPIIQAGTMASMTGDLEISGLPGERKMLLSLVANHGNSGGPIFDEDGAVIGVLEGALPSLPQVNEPALAVSGLAVAIPAQFIDDLVKKSPPEPK